MNPRNIRLTLEYDGTRYAGWQLQKNALTIQGVLEEGLGRLLDQAARVTGASRTDAGVHALGQVANFRTFSRLQPVQIRRGLNALLPADVAVLAAEEADPEFNARRQAKGKVYA